MAPPPALPPPVALAPPEPSECGLAAAEPDAALGDAWRGTCTSTHMSPSSSSDSRRFGACRAVVLGPPAWCGGCGWWWWCGWAECDCWIESPRPACGRRAVVAPCVGAVLAGRSLIAGSADDAPRLAPRRLPPKAVFGGRSGCCVQYCRRAAFIASDGWNRSPPRNFAPPRDAVARAVCGGTGFLYAERPTKRDTGGGAVYLPLPWLFRPPISAWRAGWSGDGGRGSVLPLRMRGSVMTG
mmetsp:Transcript_31287/g.96660  ORF Transcript_31287/g.96660 Transcript_31287/m.96660 type:complete len:240 (+) Transcript_31287:260-979(+)